MYSDFKHNESSTTSKAKRNVLSSSRHGRISSGTTKTDLAQ